MTFEAITLSRYQTFLSIRRASICFMLPNFSSRYEWLSTVAGTRLQLLVSVTQSFFFEILTICKQL